MILKELRLDHFGKFTKKEVSLKPGFNVVYGKNEAGKSTMHSFIRGMLFGIERQRGRATKDDFYTKYIPWKSNGLYDGTLDLVSGNKEYRIYRNFLKQNREIKIIDLATGKEVPLIHKDIADLVPGLTECLYRNTVSIEQLHTGTDEELKKEVRNYIANLSVSKTNEVDVNSALIYLNGKKKEIQNQLSHLDIEKLSKQLDEKQAQLNEADQLNEEMLRLELEEKKLREEKAIFLSKEETVLGLNGDKNFAYMKPKIEEYIRLQRCCEEKKREYYELTSQMNNYLRVENCHKTIYQDVEEVQCLHEQTHKMQVQIGEIRRKEEHLITKSHLKKRVFYTMPVVLLLLILSVIFYPVLGVSVCVAALIFLVSIFLVKQARLQKIIQEYENQEVMLDRQCIEAEAKKREIYLRNNVTGDAELRYKLQMLKDNQEELEQFSQHRKEVEKEQIQIYTRMEHLEKDIRSFVGAYFKEYTINEDLIADLEYEVNLQKEKIANDLELITNQYNETLVKLERVKWKLSNFAEFEDEFQKGQKLFEEVSANRVKLEKDLEAVLLAIDSINALSIDIHDSFGDQINGRLSYIIEKVTNGRYKDVKMDENLNIKVLRDYDYIPFEKLSAGAIAEIYLALRITVADILNGTKTLPLILDDAFVLYDDERLEATLRELSNIVNRQIIIFTCHEREINILSRCELDYHCVRLT